MKIKTSVFRDMLNKAVKICTFDKMLPLTSLIEIEFDEKGISMKTTDNVTTMIIRENVEGLTPARVVVDAAIITALVNKITTEDIELTISNASLTITGNGVYNLEIRVDESGEIVKLPAINQELANQATKDFDFQGIAERLNICSSAIATGEDAKELGNYYMGEMITATDQLKVSSVSNIESMKSDELFIREEFGRHLIGLGFAKAKYIVSNETLIIVGENFVLSTTMMLDEKEQFVSRTLQGVKQFLAFVYNNRVKIKKSVIMDLLDRVSLFVSEYDGKTINCTFLKDNIKVTNRKGTCDEVIPYEEKILDDSFIEFSSLLNIEWLKSLLSVLPSEVIEFQFGNNEVAIRIVDGDISQIISLSDVEE